ncbi:MAG: hypothetical protein KGS46_02405 [Chloroflexi bacterium]|jgi:hypothetical protein|nr:hypothetical protein [Chloroflexota bacterium]
MAADPLSELLSGVLRGAGHGNAQQHVQNASSDQLSDLLGSILSSAGQQMPQQQSSGNAMGDILGNILGSAGQQKPAQRPQQQSSGNAMGDILGSILGGGGQQSNGNAIGDILGSILGGGQQVPQQRQMPRQSSGDPLADLLGGILGRGASPAPVQPVPTFPTSGGSSILDVLGSLVGGALQSGSSGIGAQGGGLTDLIGMMMGAGQMGSLGVIAGTPFAPIINALAQKLGVNPIIATIVVGYLLNKLFTSQAQPQHAVQQSASGLDSLLDRFGTGKPVDRHYIQHSGIAEELAETAGLNPNQATDALQTLIGMLGGNTGQPTQSSQSSLKGLLDQ